MAAVWAAAFPVVSSLGPHRVWGASACVGYLCAAVAVLSRCSLGRAVSVWIAGIGAVLVPLVVLVLTGGAQSEVGVVERAGLLTVRQGTPYLADPQAVVEVTPYLPGMALFGLPGAVVADGWEPLRYLGDARLWCAAAFLGCLWAAGRVLGARARPRGTGQLVGAALIASPVVALPLAVSGVDLPLTGLLCLALALAARHRPVAAGLALALACSLKWTAWPALAVVAALLAHRAGLGAALRGTGVAVAGTVLAVLPSALLAPGPLVEQVFAFPTGRGEWETPAASPLPGRLLADLGPFGWYAAMTLLAAGGVAVAVSLWVRPPAGLVPAADRLAVGLCTAFLLAPAGRFGYLALPVLLSVWARLAEAPSRVAPARSRVVAAGSAARPVLVGGDR
ncbi:glycosyltransferase 87 family protein [Streptomyces albidoflavus]|uniref:glycosyltransferase 87 family protein n=1 Tax=Streptomyces albidoflavus TaxID=1886 RepID=UPI00352D6095|nr:glycosyltransferase 87 family protein [Streptomyces albidoflavus]WTC44611.1 glycosyltransferase 87 family protein [Streptomyces albidoflavus]WTD40975.1 glycosyltransferase 87 family protein [Streptomyces albidoflavus]WTD84756.1 glycosyltransferase 87 family protein [Streptomyces albidoflavus]